MNDNDYLRKIGIGNTEIDIDDSNNMQSVSKKMNLTSTNSNFSLRSRKSSAKNYKGIEMNNKV
jgi:hypothetical protein